MQQLSFLMCATKVADPYHSPGNFHKHTISFGSERYVMFLESGVVRVRTAQAPYSVVCVPLTNVAWYLPIETAVPAPDVAPTPVAAQKTVRTKGKPNV